jgi:hypothetical protein
LLATLAVTGYGVAIIVTEFQRGGALPGGVMAGIGAVAAALCAWLGSRRPGAGRLAAVWCVLIAAGALIAAFAIMIVTVGIALGRLMD